MEQVFVYICTAFFSAVIKEVKTYEITADNRAIAYQTALNNIQTDYPNAIRYEARLALVKYGNDGDGNSDTQPETPPDTPPDGGSGTTPTEPTP